MAEPIALAISTVGLLVPIVQVLQGSIKVADLWSARGLNYPRQPTAVERHIRTTYGDFVYMLLKLYLPGVTDQMEHIDGDVLHNGDEVIHEFRKSYVNDCNMTSVAVSIYSIYLFLFSRADQGSRELLLLKSPSLHSLCQL